MAAGWRRDKRWSDRFVGEIGAICGRHLIGPAPLVEDQLRNSDLMVLVMRDIRIACRVRRHKYLARYGAEFTIRGGRPSGIDSELSKIVAGWGDYFFYGFADAQERALAGWLLGDLYVFRSWFARTTLRDGMAPGIRRRNDDDSSWFFVYRVDELPTDFVVARSVDSGATTRNPCKADSTSTLLPRVSNAHS